MKTNEKIRQTVTETYKRVAQRGGLHHKPHRSATCCGSRERPANSSQQECGSQSLSPEMTSLFIGYSKTDLADAPKESNLGLGCGSPRTITSIKKGETIVDLGCGAGFDCFLAAKETGTSGRVIGVDMTPEMISLARKNKEKGKSDNVEFRLGEIEHLPVPDNTADLIISNCVINLSPEKQQVFSEAFRVLKPGGRLAISDILALKELPEDVKQDPAMVCACIGGAATAEQTEKMLIKAGFEKIRITPEKISPELIDQWLPESRIASYISPASIEAVKPA